MADLSHLGGLNPVEALDLANYAENKESTFRMPAAGRYTVQAPTTFPAAAFGRTKAGSLSVQIDPTVVGPTNEGLTIRFTKVSAKVFKRGDSNVSQAGDYLKACGFSGELKDEQQIADAIESTAGSIYEVKLDWRVYNTKTGFSLQGMTRFPKLADGTYQSWVEDPNDTDESGAPKRLRANLVVDRYIPQGQ